MWITQIVRTVSLGEGYLEEKVDFLGGSIRRIKRINCGK